MVPADLAKNFFVTEDDLGKNRAESVYKNLCEMNPDVNGKSDDRDFKQLVGDVDFIK